jgi:GTP-binding protein
MKITSATFVKGVMGDDPILLDGTPQVAFIGRSNAGKSSLINSLTERSKLAITSSTPGRTKELNVFHINNTHYFIDLPGYGYAKVGGQALEKLNKLIVWYLLESKHMPKVVLLIDANVGPTKDDIATLKELERTGKDIVVVANKVDKIKKSYYLTHMRKLQEKVQGHKLFPYSSVTKVGVDELRTELLTL